MAFCPDCHHDTSSHRIFSFTEIFCRLRVSDDDDDDKVFPEDCYQARLGSGLDVSEKMKAGLMTQ